MRLILTVIILCAASLLHLADSSEGVDEGTVGGGSFPSALDVDYANDRSFRGAGDYEAFLYPNGDAQAEWDTVFPSGDHYAQVDETDEGGDGGTTYVETGTNSDEDRFNMADLGDPGEGYTLDVQVFAVHYKGAQQGCNFQAGIRIGSTNYQGFSTSPVNGVYTNESSTIWMLNPDDSEEWEYGDIDSLITYITTDDASPEVRCTQVGVRVLVNFSSNSEPYFTSTPITDGINGTFYSYDANASDDDSDSLTYDLEGNGTSFLSIHSTLGFVNGTSTECGWYYVNVSVTDGVMTGYIWQNYTLWMNNSAPFFTSTPVTEGVVNETYIYDCEATDPNGDNLIFSIDSSPSETKLWLSYNTSSGQLEGLPETIGSYDVNLSVTDVLGSTTWQNFSITIEIDSSELGAILTLSIALVFCLGLSYFGLKEKVLMVLAGMCWIICSLVVFMEYGQEFMGLGVGTGMIMFGKVFYDVWH